MIFTVHQAKTQLSKLIALAEAGEEVVIARGNKPVVTIRAVANATAKPRRTPGAWKGKFEWSNTFSEPLPDEELTLWNGEAD